MIVCKFIQTIFSLNKEVSPAPLRKAIFLNIFKKTTIVRKILIYKCPMEHYVIINLLSIFCGVLNIFFIILLKVSFDFCFHESQLLNV